MSLELLQPVAAEVLSGLALHPPQVLGKNIQIHTEATGFPELNEVRIAVVGVAEIRNSYFEQAHFDAAFRKAWYALYPGNWQLGIADLGICPTVLLLKTPTKR